MRTAGIEAKASITEVKGILGSNPGVTIAACRDLPQFGETGSYSRSHRLARLVRTTAVPRCPMDAFDQSYVGCGCSCSGCSTAGDGHAINRAGCEKPLPSYALGGKQRARRLNITFMRPASGGKEWVMHVSRLDIHLDLPSLTL